MVVVGHLAVLFVCLHEIVDGNTAITETSRLGT